MDKKTDKLLRQQILDSLIIGELRLFEQRTGKNNPSVASVAASFNFFLFCGRGPKMTPERVAEAVKRKADLGVLSHKNYT